MKENRSLKIFISCALGAGIGGLIALQLNHYLWWLGLVVGGFVGYMSYEFEKVVSAVPLAWWYAVAAVSVPKKESLSYAIRWISYFLLFVASWAIPAFFILYFITKSPTLFWTTLIVMVAPLMLSHLTSRIKLEDITGLLTECNFLTVFFYHLPRGLWWLISKTPALISITWRFFKFLFILIHSDIRLLCGVDAVIGACVGYFTGNAIIGAISGGVFGVINYELISKRVLGLAPRR